MDQVSLSIYDAAESHRINPACNALINSSTNQVVNRQLDNGEPDGETAGFEMNGTGLLIFHMYIEVPSGIKQGRGLIWGRY